MIVQDNDPNHLASKTMPEAIATYISDTTVALESRGLIQKAETHSIAHLTTTQSGN